MDNEKLVTVASYSDEAGANIAKAILEDEGIEAVVVGGNLGGAYPLPITMRVDVQVRSCDANKAERILDENMKEEGEGYFGGDED